jgi:hypothetical protein
VNRRISHQYIEKIGQRRHVAVAAVAVALLAMGLPAPAGQAAASHGREAVAAAVPAMLPRVRPAAGTPHFPLGTPTVEQVRQLVQCGSIMYAVGTFSTVEQGGRTFTRNNAFSFHATAPFTMTAWNPDVNGVVDSITFNSGHCAHAYIGGDFTRVHGRAAARIAEVRTTAPGFLVRAFRHSVNNEVETLASYRDHILAGGLFTRINGNSVDAYMASLNPGTGRDDGFLRLRISGHYTFPHAVPNVTKVFNQQISHGGRRELVEGDFTSVAGKRRHQIFMLNLASRPRATLNRWTSPRFDGRRGYPPKGFFYNCADREPFYIKSAAWSVHDRTVYLATTGFRPFNNSRGFPLRGLCDTESAFGAGRTAKLKWISYTGCDSLASVAAAGGAVFFGGHQRWVDNRDGCNFAGPAAITALGLNAMNPATGRLVVSANGTSLYSRSRGFGAGDMLVTKAGLWIASDNFANSQTCDGVSGLSGICFLPNRPRLAG